MDLIFQGFGLGKSTVHNTVPFCESKKRGNCAGNDLGRLWGMVYGRIEWAPDRADYCTDMSASVRAGLRLNDGELGLLAWPAHPVWAWGRDCNSPVGGLRIVG